jgi:hypothetical protein
VKCAAVEDKARISQEIKSLIAELNADNDLLSALIVQMRTSGYVEATDDSSSDEEDIVEQCLDADNGGIAALLRMKRGTAAVCTGKACTRKGKSDIIMQTLEDYWGDKVSVQACSCMGKCKLATNMRIDSDAASATVTSVSLAALEEAGLRIAQPLATI